MILRTMMKFGNTNLFHILAMSALVLLVGISMANAAPLTVTGGWFRAMPKVVPSGGYFTLRNDSNEKVTLTGVQSPACGMLMMHQSLDKGGMSTMKPVDSVDVAPGATLRFAPGGYHLMCMDAKPILKPGGSVPVTLHFADGKAVTVPFAVRNAAGK